MLWNPKKRPTATESLKYPYFTNYSNLGSQTTQKAAMEKLHGKSHFGNHSMPKIEKEPSSLKKNSVKSRSEIPSYKEQNFKLDDTVDLMEELLGNPTPRQPKKEPTRTSIYSTGRKSSVGNSNASSFISSRARPEKRASVPKSTVTNVKYGAIFSDDDGVDSDDDLISDILAQKKPSQKPMKSAIASDLDELLGFGNGDDELDDLENLLTHGAGKTSKQSKSKTDAHLTTKMNPRKVVRPDKNKLPRKTGSNWQFDFSPDSPSLDLGSLSKENAGRIEKPKLVPNKRLTPRDHYLQSARYLPSSGAGSRIPPPSTISNNQNQNSNNSSHANTNHSSWRYGNTAPSILPLRQNQQRRRPLPELMPGLGRTNWAAKYR